jgi:hypothetical protein
MPCTLVRSAYSTKEMLAGVRFFVRAPLTERQPDIIKKVQRETEIHFVYTRTQKLFVRDASQDVRAKAARREDLRRRHLQNYNSDALEKLHLQRHAVKMETSWFVLYMCYRFSWLRKEYVQCTRIAQL